MCKIVENLMRTQNIGQAKRILRFRFYEQLWNNATSGLQEPHKLVYAAPEDLKWRYSIIVHKNGNVEFALLDQYFEYASDSPQFYTSILAAQEKAAQHR